MKSNLIFSIITPKNGRPWYLISEESTEKKNIDLIAEKDAEVERLVVETVSQPRHFTESMLSVCGNVQFGFDAIYGDLIDNSNRRDQFLTLVENEKAA